MKRRPSSLLCVASAVLLLFATEGVSLPAGPIGDNGRGAVTAFVNVNLVPLEHEGIVPGQTVIVRDGRIAVVGPADTTLVPKGAAVIQGNGHYLMPGLADMHIHLDSYVDARPNFEDGPLYLSYGITTVLNLRGLPEHLEWRKRIQDGQLLAPNLYTAGDFINEPRVRTADEVEHEVISQFRAGYDVLKYHPIVDMQTGRDLTTEGLTTAAFLRMMETARRFGIPVIGHAPTNLPLSMALQEHESLAHGGEFVHSYFFPRQHIQEYVLWTAGSLGLFFLSLLGWLFGAAIRHFRRPGSTALSSSFFMSCALIFALSALLSLGLSIALILSGSPLLLALDTIVVLALGIIVIAMMVLTTRAWKRKDGPTWARLNFVALNCAGLAFFASMCHWVPILWRSSDAGINRVATSAKVAGIWVEPTLVLYDTFNLDPQQRALLLNERAFKAMPLSVRQNWQDLETVQLFAPWERAVFRNYPVFTRRLTRALHEAGVPLMAGTDAPGVPFETPGASLHREFRLLLSCGLSPYEVLQTATTNAAKFLRKEDEFGTVTVGKRADLLLVQHNPLRDIETASEPLGVMVRGKWLSPQELQKMLDVLAQQR